MTFLTRLTYCAALLLLVSVARTGILPYTGINLTGGEWTIGPFWPTRYEVDFFASRGANIFRLAFGWEFLQPEMSGEFDMGVWNSFLDVITYITETKGLSVILEPHNFSRYKGQIIGTDAPVSALTNLWTRIATALKSNQRVFFNIMNEPSNMETLVWASNARATLQAIRDTGSTNLVLIPGNGFTGAGFWVESWYDTADPPVSNAVALLNITDPADNWAYEMHTYFDQFSSGGPVTCLDPPVVPVRLEVTTNWLRQNGRRAFLGELGGSVQSNCLIAINDSLNYLEANTDVWMGWCYWAAGPRYSYSHLSVEPVGYPPRENAQMLTIMPHMHNQIVNKQYPDITPASCNNNGALTIYSDQLEGGWYSRSWAVNVIQDGTKSHTGTYAISFIPDTLKAVYLDSGDSDISLSDYNAVEFWIAGDSPEGQRIEVSFWQEHTRPLGTTQPVHEYIEGRKITSTFQKVVMPFEAFSVAGKRITGITFGDASDSLQSTVYIDDIKLVCTTIAGGSLSGTPQVPQASSPQTQGPQASSPQTTQTPQSLTPTGQNNVSTAASLFLSTFVLVVNLALVI